MKKFTKVFAFIILSVFAANIRTLATVNQIGPPSIAQISGNICAGTSDAPIYVFRMQITGGATTLTKIKFKTNGTYTTSDIANFRLHYASGATSTFASSTEITAAMITAATAGPQVMTFSQSLPNGTYNFWITCDVNTGAANDNIWVTNVVNTTPAPGTNTTTTGNVLTLIPYPVPISGNSTICFGGGTTTALLSDASPAGTWSSSNPAVATINAAGYTVTSAGQGTTTITYDNGCGTPATQLITVNAIPGPIAGISTICFGGGTITTVMSDASTGGTWSSSDLGVAYIPSTGYTVTATGQGTATITYDNGCGSPATQTVIVNNVPVTITGAPATLCVSSGPTSTALSDVSTGGTWSSSNTGVAVVDFLGNVTAQAQGVTIISYANGCGSPAAKTITVNDVPGVISGNSTICYGGGTTTTLLSDAATGGTWSSSNASVATINPAGFTVVSTGQGTTVITYSNGCGADVTKTVTVNAIPAAISGNGTICFGGGTTTTILSDASTGGTWSSLNPGIATISTGGYTVTSVAQGAAIIRYSNGCGAPATKTITVNAVPGTIEGNSTVCAGGGVTTIMLSDASTGGAWTSSNTGVATINSAGYTVNGVAQGFATIIYDNGCGSPATKVITVNETPGPISGNNTICYGAGATTTTLSDASTGGTWSSYTTATATADANTGIVTSAGGGVATIVYDNGCGSPAAYAVFVHGVPTAITGLPNVCPAVHITLSDDAYGGTWSSSNTGIATIDANTGIITGSNPGVTTVIFSTGCGSDATTTVTVDPNPTVPGPISGTTNICISTTTALTDFTPGGVWSSDNSAVATIDASGNIYNVSAGTANIRYTITNSCGSATAGTPFSIFTPVSVPAPITGTSFVCQSASLGLSDITSGGIWSSTNTAIAAVSPGGVVSGLAPGLATISYTLGNVCGSEAATLTFVVNPLPVVAPITGSAAPFCAGTTTTLSDATGGGVWSSNLTSIATVNSSGVVTGVSGDMAGASSTIVYSITNSCGTTSSTFIVTVEPLPLITPISGSSSVCTGTFIVLTDTTTGGVWSSSNSGVAGVSSGGLVSGVSAGTATISYSATNICGTAAQTKTITVNTLPSPGIITGTDTVCQGFTITLSESVGGGVWSSDVLSTAIVNTSGSVIGLAPGVDTIRYAVTNSCGTVSAQRTIWILSPEACNPSAVSSTVATTTELHVFPNPNNGTFTLSLASAANEPVMITVTNTIGARVKELTTTTNQKTELQLNTPGIYFISAATATGRYNARVVVSGQ